VPGERVLVRPVEEKSSFIRAELVDVLRPSRSYKRLTPRCPHFGQCGGCQLQHLDYPDQIKIKKELLFSLLEAKGLLGGAGGSDSGQMVMDASCEPWHWRARARLKVFPGRSGFRVGFFAKRSRRLVEIGSCPVLKAGLEGLIPALGGRIASSCSGLMAKKGRGAKGLEIVMAEGLDGKRAAFAVSGHKGKRGRGRGDLLPLFGDGCTEDDYCAEVSWKILFYQGPHAPNGLYTRPWSFFQANPRQNERLMDVVLKMAQGSALGTSILELFSGAGNFTIPLARAGFHLTALESDQDAIEMAGANAAANSARDVRLLKMDADADLSPVLRERFDLLLLDPPRTGARQACRQIAASRIPAIIYVSCDPMTLVRDLLILKAGGYMVEDLRLVDMFPQTAHMEAVVMLVRKGHQQEG
jgi:23S rRNA (uracil1939-C5)-methyltransferase